MTAPASTWYAPNCPPWCNRQHAAVLVDPLDPMADEVQWADSLVFHCAPLAALSDGLAVELVEHEGHPDTPTPSTSTPAVVVYLPDHHDTTGTTPAQLRRWAAALDAAADAADTHTRKGPR